MNINITHELGYDEAAAIINKFKRVQAVIKLYLPSATWIQWASIILSVATKK